MSHNSHRNAVLDESSPLAHRASHARSCAIHVANRLGLRRDDVIRQVEASTGVDLAHPASVEDLLLAFDVLERLV